MKKHKDGSVKLTKAEFAELNKAYQGLYDILSEFPTYLGDFFRNREDFIAVMRWQAQLQGEEFVEEDYFGEDEDDEESEDEDE